MNKTELFQVAKIQMFSPTPYQLKHATVIGDLNIQYSVLKINNVCVKNYAMVLCRVLEAKCVT